MSGLDLTAIREAIALTLRTALGSNVKVYDYVQTPQIFPCVIIPVPERVDYSKTFNRGSDTVTFNLQCLVGPMSPTSQKMLDDLMSGTGDFSIIEALTADRTLGGVIARGKVISMETGAYQVPNTGEIKIGVDIVYEVVT